MIAAEQCEQLVQELCAQHGAVCAARARAGIAHVAARWRDDDGTPDEFAAFVRKRFVADEAARACLLDRLEDALFHIHGHLSEIHRMLHRWQAVARDDDPGIDDLLSQFSPAPDLREELYRSKLAFVALLNFPTASFVDMLRDGPGWRVEDWAAVRIANAVVHRVPRHIDDLARAAHQRAADFYYNFHIPLDAITLADGAKPFAPGRKLLAHWLVREEIRAGYGAPDGLPRQRVLARVMGRHVDGTIPQAVMAGAAQSWEPFSNDCTAKDGADTQAQVGSRRYAVWRELFDVAQATDPFYPDYPTHIQRASELHNQLPMAQIEQVLTELLTAPARATVMQFARRRLQRPLEPFDIYYNNIASREPIEELNAAVTRRFPRFAALQEQLPAILRELGFDADTAAFLAAHIQVDAARGSGHASGAGLPEYPSLLRTNHANGMLNWPGFVTAMHELGHCIEQVISLHRVPRRALRGVPNLGTTEAFAFTFQEFARPLVGVPYPPQYEAGMALNTYLNACEIAGASMVDIACWRWLYAHPAATPERLRDATLAMCNEVWQHHFAAWFGADENHLLGAYQHMIGMMLYLPNYVIGHVLAHQIRAHLTTHDLAGEVVRMCAQGDLTPQVWLQRALGSDLSPAQLINDAARACQALA
jgi:hypothetical protein